MGPGDSGAAATTSHEARDYALQASRRAGRSLERSLEAVGRAANHSALLRELAAAIVAAAAAPGVADVLLERGLQADTLRSVRVELDDAASEIVIRAALGEPSDGVDQADQADLAEEPSAPASTAGRQLATLAGYAAARRSLLYQAERRDRQLLQAVVDELPIGVVVVEGPDGREVLANPEARRILGRSIGGWPDSRLRALHPDGTPYEPASWPVRRALRGEAISGEKVELASTLAEPSRIVQVSAVPVPGDEGSVVAVVATLADVTEARQSDAAREAFFGILSHEVKSPLAAIFGGVKVLELHGDGLEPGLRVELLRDVGSETERLYRLVENLLVLARVEARVPAFAAEPILLQHLVPRIVAHENARWPLAGFRVLTDPAPPTVVGEESGIEQALGNLLGNAAKYAGDQGPIEVCVTGEDDGVAVRVLDVGPGLAPDAGDRLFHLFYRSADARKAAPGAGIGLFVAARLVESMGGRIWARQREDRGAEFGFWLPQLRDEPDEEESQAAPAPGDVGPAAG